MSVLLFSIRFRKFLFLTILAFLRNLQQYEKDALLKEAEDIKLKKLENKGKEETLKKSWEQYQKAKRRQEATSGKLNKRETVIKMQEDEIKKNWKRLKKEKVHFLPEKMKL